MLDLERKVEQVMDNTIRVFSGRTFSSEDLELIKWTCERYPTLARRELARTICEFIGWTIPGGFPKELPCIEFLEILESEGFIRLPAKRTRKRSIPKVAERMHEISRPDTDIVGSAGSLEPITLEIARVGESLNRWKAYIDEYHVLGYKMVFGSRLHYFVKSGEKELGCIQFSASSWALRQRDKWIGWGEEDRKTRLNLIVNNSRFLIFPWVKVKNLASMSLSIATHRIQEDWLREFYYAPVLLETFVDTEKYKGTCYKAANWTYLGETQGRGRMDRTHEQKLSKKAIFMYPLQRDFKAILKGEKPCKMVNPDE